MPALKMMEIDGTTLIAIEDPRIAAAMKAFGYVWQELDEVPGRADVVVDNLDDLIGKLVALKAGPISPGTNGDAI